MATEKPSQHLCFWGWGGLTTWKGWRNLGAGARSGAGAVRAGLTGAGAEGISNLGTLVGPFPWTTTGSVS